MYLVISLPEFFSFSQNLRFLNRSPEEPTHQVFGDSLYKLLTIGEHSILLKIKLSTENRLEVLGIPAPNWTLPDIYVTDYLRKWLDLDRDLGNFYLMAGKDPILAPVCAKFRGLRMIGMPNLFEALCWAILGQQVNLTFAYRMKRRLVENWGQSFQDQGQVFYDFPRPETIAALRPEDLRPLQISGAKAKYMIGIAQATLRGELESDALLALKNEAAIAKYLCQYKGIGNWTASYVMMKSLGISSAFPIQDVGLHNALKAILKRATKPSIAEIRALAEPWTGWEAYATFYLWFSLLPDVDD